jgi:hypothetical protein
MSSRDHQPFSPFRHRPTSSPNSPLRRMALVQRMRCNSTVVRRSAPANGLPMNETTPPAKASWRRLSWAHFPVSISARCELRAARTCQVPRTATTATRNARAAIASRTSTGRLGLITGSAFIQWRSLAPGDVGLFARKVEPLSGTAPEMSAADGGERRNRAIGQPGLGVPRSYEPLQGFDDQGVVVLLG